MGNDVATIICHGNHGGYAHGQNPQAQLFFQSPLASPGKVRLSFWWKRKEGEDAKPMAIRAFVMKPPTPCVSQLRDEYPHQLWRAVSNEPRSSTASA